MTIPGSLVNSPEAQLRVCLILPTPRWLGYTLRCDGELDLHTVTDLTDSVADLAENEPWIAGRALDIDLSGLSFVDIVGLRALAQARSTLSLYHRDVRIIGVGRQLRLLAEEAHGIGWSPMCELLA